MKEEEGLILETSYQEKPDQEEVLKRWKVEGFCVDARNIDRWNGRVKFEATTSNSLGGARRNNDMTLRPICRPG